MRYHCFRERGKEGQGGDRLGDRTSKGREGTRDKLGTGWKMEGAGGIERWREGRRDKEGTGWETEGAKGNRERGREGRREKGGRHKEQRK